MRTYYRRRLRTFLLIPPLLVALAIQLRADPVQVGHVEAELVSEAASIVPGQQFQAALRLNLDEHWHVYWRNPGDAGLPPKLVWHLPEGFSVGEFQYPAPEIIVTEPLVSYGYVGDVLYPVTITAPSDLVPGKQVTLTADVSWIVCEKVCIPGKTNLSLTLAVSEKKTVPDSLWSPRIEDALARIPSEGKGWSASYSKTGNSVRVSFTAPDSYVQIAGRQIHFLPYEQGILSNSVDQELSENPNGFDLTIKQSEYLDELPSRMDGILLFAETDAGSKKSRAIAVSAEYSDEIGAQISGVYLLKILLFAFIGGLILNLMPCVLPVLSLKIMGFVSQAGEKRSKIFGHGLIFTVGVLISFWILAGVLIALRAGGEQLGWGFQLQSPTFLMILSGFMFLFGLSLLGVFEIGTSVTSVAGAVTGRSGHLGSFINGVTATVVATPCTAPFMGPALGVALSQPAFTSLLIFSSLGLGMAAPYLVISGFPALLRFVPKPGAWMETLKQIMGFFLLGTVIWLGWVLSIQAGGIGVVVLMLTLLLLAVGGWILGRWGTFSARPGAKRVAYGIAAIFVLGGMTVGIRVVDMFGSPAALSAAHSGEGILWQEFSVSRVEELRSQGRPVFIDFTAAWCLSCQVNERIAFSSKDVQEKFASLGITALQADWTSRDETIARALASYGRNSVPLYVLYDTDGEKTILPEILTPGIVLDALDKIQLSQAESTAQLASDKSTSKN